MRRMSADVLPSSVLWAKFLLSITPKNTQQKRLVSHEQLLSPFRKSQAAGTSHASASGVRAVVSEVPEEPGITTRAAPPVIG